ncbi:mitochondrial 54S ribosomal protein mL38 Ecym_8172 [Eremothecium cymbalariae DBVPG|uniref:Large ribosomal subunit protein mL38 n=1 Tax=Eremothecium cymbalariae (strain CBS 270.75 / DBVPG 7215 / KCTC 17166 / NRRL Y-17582) TaxID=931890 RepID=G8JX84_ERECY|nr:Hypothetical protein Ecym_8172 [Eremothecium cymbalariae DBVPG\
MFRRSFHSNRVLAENLWSDFTKRSKSYGIKNEVIKKYILEGNPTLSPPSIKRRSNRIKYRSPEFIDDIFKTSYEYLAAQAKSKLDSMEKETDAIKKVDLLVESEINNPEMQYNFQYNDKLENNPEVIDYNEPVYRHLGRKHWESYGQMLLMQRLETLAVIPDTLSTLKPVAEVNIRFPFSTGVNKWIEPGEILSSNVTSTEPTIKIQEYDHHINPSEQLYTILVVNPDEPDLAADSFTTVLNFGLKNIKLSYNDNIVDPRRYSKDNVIAPYIPPVPEKNAGKQRFAVWVFRQSKPILPDQESLPRSNFDIRSFAAENDLTPIGAHIWRSEWDSNVANVREKYKLGKGRVFHRVRR